MLVQHAKVIPTPRKVLRYMFTSYTEFARLRIVTGLPTARRSTLGLEHISMLEFLYLTIPIEHPQWYCYTPIGLYQDVAVCSSFHLVLQLVLASGDFDKNTCTSSWRQSRISSCHSIGH